MFTLQRFGRGVHFPRTSISLDLDVFLWDVRKCSVNIIIVDYGKDVGTRLVCAAADITKIHIYLSECATPWSYGVMLETIAIGETLNVFCEIFILHLQQHKQNYQLLRNKLFQMESFTCLFVYWICHVTFSWLFWYSPPQKKIAKQIWILVKSNTSVIYVWINLRNQGYLHEYLDANIHSF